MGEIFLKSIYPSLKISILFSKVIVSFLKRERERFALFVLRCYCGLAWTFLGIPERLHERSRTFHERFRPFVTFIRPEKIKNGHETARNGLKWSYCKCISAITNVWKITVKNEWITVFALLCCMILPFFY